DAASLIQGRPESSTKQPDSDADSDSQANSLANRQQGGGSAFNNINDFTGSADFTAIFSDSDESTLYTQNLGTGSDGFMLMAEITINDILRRHFSFIERENENGTYTARIIQRASEDLF
ncbi:MAG: hypothetical protein AAFZ92_11220, partial [Pseudomonadota bacterium]